MASSTISDISSKAEYFLREKYYNEMHAAARQDTALIADFSTLDRFDPLLADQLLEQPRSLIEAFENAFENIVQKKLHVRFRNLPESRNIRIRNIRAKHMNRLWTIDATIKSASEVKPQIYEAIFECPDCSAKIIVQQDTNLLQKPRVCECGRRGDFSLVDKKLYDIRWLQGIEPFELTSGERPGEISIFLKEDLTTPRMQTKTDPGSRLKITGVLRELPKRIKGKLSTKMDMYVEANHVEPSDIEFEELEITEEDEKQIREMAADPAIYEKLRASIAPGIWGFDEIKDSIVLQLFGGVRHTLADGSTIRGNIHILLTGDPGVGKSITGNSRILYKSPTEHGLCKIEDIFSKVESAYPTLVQKQMQASGLQTFTVGKSDTDTIILENRKGIQVLALNQKTHKMDWVPVTAFVKHKSPEKLVKITTASGRKITGTKDHSFLILNKEGNIVPIEGDNLKTSMYVPIPVNTHRERIDEIDISQHITRKTNALNITPKIKLDKEFGFFLGAFLAEGCIIKKENAQRISIASNSKEVQDRVCAFAQKIRTNPRIMKSSDGKRSDSVNIYSRSLVRFLKKECYSDKIIKKGKGSGARLKRVPDFAFFAPKDFLYELLSGIFSGDGYYFKRNPTGNRTKNSFSIGLETVSKGLIDGVAEILSSVGIFVSVGEKRYSYKGEKRKRYYVYITGKYAQMFVDAVDLIDKKQPTTRIAEKDAADSIPCGSLLYEIVRELGYSKRKHENADKRRTFAAMMRTVRRRNRIGRRRLERIYSILTMQAEKQGNAAATQKLKNLRTIMESDVVWDKIISVEEVDGEDYVYDLSIAGNETFVANGIAVHNTILLKLVSSVVPRGRYVSGSGVSGAGLTATVVKNEAIGGWVLEAGALILCNKGMISIDEFDKMNKDDQIAMHEATSVESYHGKTPITLANGEVRSIKDLVEGEFEQNKSRIIKGDDCFFVNVSGPEILCTDFEKITPKKSIRVSKHTAPDFFYKITLQNGKTLTVTPNHPCFVFDGTKFIETPAEKLSVGEYVPIPKTMPIAGQKQQFDIHQKNVRLSRYNVKHIKMPVHNSPEFSKFLGYLISEGSHEINRGKLIGVSFTNSNKTLLNDFTSTTHDLFGLKPYIQHKPGRTMLRYISSELKNFVHQTEPSLLENAYKKKIPDIIFRCSNHEIAHMLRAMFAGDGSVHGRKDSLYVTYTTTSRELADQLHELLLRFSITSYIQKIKPHGRTRQMLYTVTITGTTNLRNFVEKIGFVREEKNTRIRDFLKSKIYRTPYAEKVPVGPFMIDVIKKLRLSQIEVFNQVISYKKYNLSRKKLQEAVGVVEQRIQELKDFKKDIHGCSIQELRKIRKKLKISTNEIAPFLNVCHQMVSYAELKKIEKYSDNYKPALITIIDRMLKTEDAVKSLRSLAFGDIALCRIKEVRKIRNTTEKWVYDITVPGEVFVSNGMVLHNTVSIAKASIVATLPAQTAVLAGANPKYGRFDPFQPITDQIQIPETLLSRFDLKFALRDRPDKIKDEQLAAHIISTRTKPETAEPPIDRHLLRKYIAYAKHIEKLELGNEAAKMLKEFYVDMRTRYATEEIQTVSITLRQYEALIRLAEASARVRLDTKIRKEDAERAINLMRYSLSQLGYDYETGRIDIDRIESGVTASKRTKIGLALNIISALQKESPQGAAIEDIRAEAETQGIEDIDDILDILRKRGEIFEPRSGFIKKL